MRREIVVSAGDRDIAGLRRQSGSVVFYSGDKGFTIHVTAHDPNPARDFHTGGIRATREPESSTEPAAVVFVGPVTNDSFERSLDDLARAVRLGSLIVYTDADSLPLYRRATRRVARLAVPPEEGPFVISAWLFRRAEVWNVDPTTEWCLFDVGGPTWMGLLVERAEHSVAVSPRLV